MSAAEEKQKAQASADSVLDNVSSMQNYSTLKGIDGNVSAPERAAGSNGFGGLSQSIHANAFLMVESSDSEGPLPEIDLGISSEEESGMEA